MYYKTGYYSARTVNEIFDLWDRYPGARLVCGGSDLLQKIRDGEMDECNLIGLREIGEMQRIELREDGLVKLGAAVTLSQITKDPIINENARILKDAFEQIRRFQNNQVETLGGNLCNGAGNTHIAPICFLLDMQMLITRRKGTRVIGMEQLYKENGETTLKEGEVLTHLLLPAKKYKDYTGHYLKYSPRKSEEGTDVGCGVICKLDPEKQRLEDIRITFGLAPPVPHRCHVTEKELSGKPINKNLFSALGKAVTSELVERKDWKCGTAFRVKIGEELAKRTLHRALLKQDDVDEDMLKKIYVLRNEEEK